MFAAENGLRGDPRLQGISEAIRVVPNFPKPGIMFQDITSLVSNHRAFKDTIDIFVDRYKNMGISVVAGVEARGFIFAPAIALEIGARFIPLRKPGKLPGAVISESYELEYGNDRLEMHVGAVNNGERALVIDDLVATGGTLSAAIRLLERAGAEVVECACVIGVPELEAEWKTTVHPGRTSSTELPFLMFFLETRSDELLPFWWLCLQALAFTNSAVWLVYAFLKPIDPYIAFESGIGVVYGVVQLLLYNFHISRCRRFLGQVIPLTNNSET